MLKATRARAIVRAFTREFDQLGKASASINGDMVTVRAYDALLVMTVSAKSEQRCALPLSLLERVITAKPGATVTPDAFTDGGIVMPYSAPEQIHFNPLPVSDAWQSVTIDKATATWLYSASGDKNMPTLQNMCARDGYLTATDRFRIHAVRIPEGINGMAPAALVKAFGGGTLGFAGEWFCLDDDGVTLTGRAPVGDFPKFVSIIPSGDLPELFPASAGIQAMCASAAKIAKRARITIEAGSAAVDDGKGGAVLATIPAPVTPYRVAFNSAYLGEADLGQAWHQAEASKPAVTTDGQRMALVMPVRVA